MPPIEVIPSAKRLINSLRDLGYDFSQAIADVVDNSIEATASLISIDVEYDGDESWVRIADNGEGMTPDKLREALRYGSEREYDVGDLGKFGLGLKTASMSQCRHLSVASRWNPDRADIAAYSWDLSHIERTNRWEILPIERNSLAPTIRQPLKDTTGTVVLWQQLDRLLGFKHPYGEASRKRLLQMTRDLELHVGMVFHRFLSDVRPRKKLKIVVNMNRVLPWDPFCRSEPKTKALQPISLNVDHEDAIGDILLEPFVLPHQDDFSSPDAFRAASGPANWNQQQGFYFYRAGRMIQSGGWSNLRAPDEHTKLARIAVSFEPDLDDAFKINVAKMRVQLPGQIRDAVRDAIGPVVKLAREVYDRRTESKAIPQAATQPLAQHNSPPVAFDTRLPPRFVPNAPRLFTEDQWTSRMTEAATEEERPVVLAVLARARAVHR